MTRLFLTFAILLSVCCDTYGQAAAVIAGPAKAELGDLVVLDASESVGTAREWKLIGSDKTFLPVDGGLRAVFASGTPGVYRFVLAVADGGETATVDLAVHEVTIGAPKPPTPPTPDDEDDTPPDDGDAPFPADGLSVVITAEQSELGRLPIEQAAIFAEGEFRAWLTEITDGRSRMWDDDLSNFEYAPDSLVAGHRVAVEDADDNEPWIVISNGRTGTSQPLPDSIEATKSLVEQYR